MAGCVVKAVWIAFVMVAVAWVPPFAEGGRDVFRWQDAAGVVHLSDHPADAMPDKGRPTTARSLADRERNCAHIRQQLALAARSGRRLRVRALEEQWFDVCR